MTAVEMLAFERGRWLHPGLKEQQIRSQFGVGPVVYYQKLNRLIDDEAAMQVDPVTVRRLQRIREVTSNRR